MGHEKRRSMWLSAVKSTRNIDKWCRSKSTLDLFLANFTFIRFVWLKTRQRWCYLKVITQSSSHFLSLNLLVVIITHCCLMLCITPLLTLYCRFYDSLGSIINTQLLERLHLNLANLSIISLSWQFFSICFVFSEIPQKSSLQQHIFIATHNAGAEFSFKHK